MGKWKKALLMALTLDLAPVLPTQADVLQNQAVDGGSINPNIVFIPAPRRRTPASRIWPRSRIYPKCRRAACGPISMMPLLSVRTFCSDRHLRPAAGISLIIGE